MSIQMASANTRPSSIVFPTVKALSTSSYLLTIDGLEDILEVILGFRCSLPLLGASGNHSAIINNISNRIITRTSINILSIDDNGNGRNSTEQLLTAGFEITLIISRQVCDNPPRKIPYYRLRPVHFGH
jgi:hypothetical protein